MKTQLSLIFSFTLAAASVTWFSQDSINAYWQQTYHQTSPLEALAPYAEWTAGAKWQQVANEQLGSLKSLSRHEKLFYDKEMWYSLQAIR